MKQLVRVWKRPTHDGQTYTYYLVYYDKDGRRKQKALGHADKRKAKKQCAQLARELRMDTVEPYSMRMSEFLEDSLARTRGQVRENPALEYDSTMRHFINVIGEILTTAMFDMNMVNDSSKHVWMVVIVQPRLLRRLAP
jgi:hypothetical protein